MTDLNIVYEDDVLLVVDKPSGLLMHPSWLDRRETDTLAGRAKTYLAQQSEVTKVHTVHRLDRPTSGLVVMCKDDHAAKALVEQFQGQTVKKRYWAVCRGFAPVAETVDYPLVEEHDRIADRFADSDKPAQEAITEFRRLGITELAIPVSRYPKMRLSWMECQPVTGRKHQIRRHLKHLRYPILGDTRHGCRHLNRAVEHSFGELFMGLRAVEISFKHPVSHEPLTFSVGADNIWSQWLDRLGWCLPESA